MTSEDSDAEECEPRAEGEIGAMEKVEGEDWDDRDLKGPTHRVLNDVRTPTATYIEEHNATHILAMG